MTGLHRSISGTIAAVALAVGVMAAPIAAHAATGTAIETLNVRESASTTAKVVGSFSKGAKINFDCYVNGDTVKGPRGNSKKWLRVGGNQRKWVAEAWVKSSNSTSIKQCAKPAAAPTSSMTKFINNTRGKSVANARGTHKGECVSLVSQYLLQVHKITSGAWGHAKDYKGTNAHMKKAGFKWHTNKNYKSGDIIVWTTGKYGHIGIWHNGKFYDQNNSSRPNPRTSNYSSMRNGAAGYWRK